jgi:hypothetical protein
LTIEDDCTIHKFAVLDDRRELIIRKGSSIAEYAAISSERHGDGDDLEGREFPGRGFRAGFPTRPIDNGI